MLAKGPHTSALTGDINALFAQKVPLRCIHIYAPLAAEIARHNVAAGYAPRPAYISHVPVTYHETTGWYRIEVVG